MEKPFDEYNGGRLPEGIVAPDAEKNVHLV
jgi:hypothetical protein